MPTPSDDTLDHSPPTAISVDPRIAHTTCPLEEERNIQQSHEETGRDVPEVTSSPSDSDTTPATTLTSALDEVETSTSAAGNMPPPENRIKHTAPADEALDRSATGTAGASASIESKDSDARLAYSMSTAAISSSFSPSFPAYQFNPHRFVPNSSSSLLRPGSKFHGTQQSDRQTYDVQVEIKQVDMDNSYLCGYLRIQGLTDDHPTLTTCFEGEIVGTKHDFKTAHPEWGSTEKVDYQHWARFPAWRPYSKQARSPNFNFKNFASREHLFMRWKEYFLVPDHKVKSITGASFEGFYYICFNQCTGTVSGIYFHSRSEKYQQLELKHVDDRGCIGAMEFR